MTDQAEGLRALEVERRRRIDRPPTHPAIARPAEARPVQRRGCARVVAVASGKGGVGKSNVAVNLAVVAARSGRRVTLVDADHGLANIDILCGISAELNMSHVLDGLASLPDVLVAGPAGMRIAPGTAGLARMADLTPDRRLRMTEALAALVKDTDLVVIDSAAGIGAGVIDLAMRADDLIVVTTPEPTAITDAYALIKLVAAARTPAPGPRVHLVVNLVEHVLDGSRVARRLVEVAQNFLGAPVSHLGTVLGDPSVGRAVAARTPVVLHHPESPASVCLRRMALGFLSGRTASLPGLPQTAVRGGQTGLKPAAASLMSA
jgi:flagellar biosynthesis protein FlhG